MLRIVLTCILCAGSYYGVVGQSLANNPTEYQELYERRIRQTTLNGVYIPKDLADAFVQLDRRIETANRAQFVSVPEETAFRELFHSFGRWITVNWGFRGGSRYSHYLRQLGLTHPEDMAEFTVRMYHRHVRKAPLDPKPVVESILERRKEIWLERSLRGTVIQDTTLTREKQKG